MKIKVRSFLIVFLMSIAFVFGFFAISPLTASATSVSNTVYTNNLAQNNELVLTGDTTLFVNADLTLKSISGDYTLEIQGDGEHTLTVNNPNGCAISVKSLQSVAPSQGTVNLTVKGGSGYFAIAADGNISLNGVKLDVTGSSGIRSANGNVTINGTNVSVVCQDGVGVIANSGSISIDSDYLFVQCAGQSGDALWEHGIGATKDVTIISDDATITGRWGVDSDKGNITLSGNISVGATKCAIIANEGTITMTGSVTAQGGDDYYAIVALGDISFDGTELEVKGSSGIRSAEGDITINGTNVSVVGQDGVGVIANSGSISIDSDYLFVQCAGQSGDALWEHGIGATKDVTIISDDATITGRWGVYAQTGNVVLSGNIWVGATKSAIEAEGTVIMTGSVTAQGGNGYYAIATTGNISFNGTKLDVSGGGGIRSSNGDVTVNGVHTSVVGRDGVAIIANAGSVYIDSDYLFVQYEGQNDEGEWKHGVGATNDVTIISDYATITGRWGVYSQTGSVTLWGNIWVGARKTAIHAEKNITVHGDLTASNTDAGYYCIVSVSGDIKLTNGTISVISTGNAVITHNGDIYLNGNITVNSSDSNSCAINAREGDIVIQGGSLNVTAGGSYAMYAYNGQIGMNQPLGLLVPENGHIDTNTIVDTNGDPASHVEIATVIKDAVSISINAPVAGEKPVSSANGVYGLPAHTSVKSIEWFVSDIPHGNNEPFVAGQNYKVKIVLKADAGYRFASGILAKLNGKDATTGWSNGGKELIITYTFSDCPASIKNVELTVVAPSDGNSISYSVTDESAGYSAGNNSNYVSWYVSDDGVSYTLMSSGDKFVGGKYYKIEIIVKTHTGYEFALKDVGSIQPDVTATVNGFKATVTKGYEQDPSEEITVTYIFGLCNDTIIEDIKIVDVPKPIPGEKPVYTVAVSGTGYSIVNKNSSQEVFEGGKYVDKYFIRNGIGWYDVTADNWIYETDTFIAGHDYQCVVYVQTDDGYEFIQDLYANPEVWPIATVNGNAATILKDGSGLTTSQQIRYTFVYEVQNVTEVGVFDIDVPVGNMTPDYTATLGNAALYEFAPYGYELVGFYWYDSEDNILSATDKFVKGETYKLEIKLVRKMDGQRVLTQFQTPVTAVLNGKVVSSADVMANSTTVYIYQTYTCDTEYLIEIDSVSATIPNPLAGEKPDYDAIVGDDDKYTVTINAWYEDSIARGIGDSNFFAPDSYFIEGRSYHVKVTFTPKPGYKFADDVVFIINGQNATTWGREGQEQTSFTAAKNPKNTYLVTYSPTEGSGTMVGDVVAEGVSFTLDECEYVAPTGYKFKAWAIGSPSGELMYPGQTIIVTADTYLIYAVWEELPHDCVGVLQSGQDETCTVDGYKDYYQCNCGKCYEDQSCTDLIPDINAWKNGDGKITAAHTGTASWTQTATTHEKKYGCCGGVVVTEENHEWNNGVCSECNYVCQHTNIAVTKQDGQSATCTVDGFKDYYQCACRKLFADEARTTPITDLAAWKLGDGRIAAEHKYGDKIVQKDAVHTQTELAAGMKAHYKCSVCQNYFDENKNPTTEGALIIAKPEHSYGDWVKDNEKHWKVCSCGLKSSENTHQYDDNSDMICNDCGWDRTVQHTHGNGTKQDGQGATCTVNGWKDYYKCSCGKIYTDAACTNEITSFEEWKNGDGKIAAVHSYGDLIAKVDATCSATGMQAHFECPVCHTLFDADKAVKTENELTIAIDANAHTYGVWTSNGDGTHTRVCTLNAEHKENGNCAGGTATCTEKAVCATCNTAYGNTVAHSHGSEWKTDANEHWNECACGDKANKAAHTDSNNDGKCDTCEYQMSTTPNTPEAPTDKGCGGCASSAPLSALAIVAVVGSAFVIKKKED